jgi:hypothetical protein
MLNNNPGHVDYWDGSAWKALQTQVALVPPAAALLPISGPYNGTTPISVKMVTVSGTTDGSGVFPLLSTTDLTGYAGVLSAVFQETGSPAYKTMLTTGGGQVLGTAYRLTDSSPMAGQPVAGLVTAFLY